MLAAEAELPYDRPPLSKEIVAGELDEPALRCRGSDWYADNASELELEDPDARAAVHRAAVRR